MDELKEFFEHYDVEKMWKILNTSPLYGWQKETLMSGFITFRRQIDRAYDYHKTDLELNRM